MRISTAIAGSALVASLLACMGGKEKDTFDKDKMRAMRSIALVGVCVDDEMGASDNGQMARISTDAELQQGISAGFDAGFTSGTLQVTPLSAVAASAGLPAGSDVPRATCASGVVPFQPGQTEKLMAYAGPTPDTQRMAAMAAHLGVDAVAAVMVHPGATIKGKETTVFSRGVNPSYAYVIDRDGQLVVKAALQAEVEGEKDATFDQVGQQFGRALAAELAAVLAGK